MSPASVIRTGGVVLAFALGLAACGGGGGKPGSPSAPPAGQERGLSLLAGTLGGPGNLDGQPGRLRRPAILALGPGGTLYVADDARVLRSVNTGTGMLATISNSVLPAKLVAMAFDGAGNRYELTATAVYKSAPGGASQLFAGAAAPGYADGAGTSARFSRARDLALDRDGNLYVADAANDTVRKITPAGIVTTLAGSPGTDAPVDGVGAAARFQELNSIAVDGAGKVWVLDSGILRMVTPGGAVTTPALTAGVQFGGAGGVGGRVAADAIGNIYVAEADQGCRIRRVGLAGAASDVAGKAGTTGSADGKGDAARFCAGSGSATFSNLVLDAGGNLYVGDTSFFNLKDSGNQTIRRITPAGDVATLAGRAAVMGNVDGAGGAAQFALAPVDATASTLIDFTPRYALAVDAGGNVHVGENDRIRKVTQAGVTSTLALPAAVAGARYYPASLAFDGSVLEVAGKVVNRIDAAGVRRFVAGPEAGLRAPNKLVADGRGNIYLQDLAGQATDPEGIHVVERKISAGGNVTTLPVSAVVPAAIVAWSADQAGNLWAAHADGAVSKTAPDGRRTLVRAAPGGDVARIPSAIASDASGNLYVAEANASRTDVRADTWYAVRKLTPAGAESLVAGKEGEWGVRLGAPGSLGPVDALAAGADGSVYVMSENAVLRLVQ